MCRMETTLHDREILDVIRDLASSGATGKLQITTGMTEGAVYFDKGQIVDASLGKLNGFQAINAVSSLLDATFNFDSSISPPTQNLTPNERMLLNDFFGIEVHREPEYFPGLSGPSTSEPAQVVPLIDVDDRDDVQVLDTQPIPHLEHEQIPDPRFYDATSLVSHSTALSPAEPKHSTDSIPQNADEVTLIRGNKHRTAVSHERVPQRRLLPALVVALAILLAVVAVALFNRSRERNSPDIVQMPPAADVSPVIQSPEVASNGGSAPADLTGNWKVVNTVEQTTYQRYKNLEVGFELAINQTGNQFTGKGQKVSENGRSLSGNSRTPIEVKGSIEGDRVEATFSESGAARKTSGRFVWRIDKASGALTGTFNTTAARSSGKSAATKTF